MQNINNYAISNFAYIISNIWSFPAIGMFPLFMLLWFVIRWFALVVYKREIREELGVHVVENSGEGCVGHDDNQDSDRQGPGF